MAIPRHVLHVYQRPAVGSRYVKSYDAFNYQHTISAQGWFDTASCDVQVRLDGDGQKMIESYLGCFVAIYVDNPEVPIWEGLINRVTYNVGTGTFTISLDEMANRVSVVYTAAANAAAETAVVNNTTSQALYGIKQEQIEFGGDPSAGTQRTSLRDTILAQRAFPLASISQAQGQTNIVHLELIGIFHTLEWEKNFSGTTAASTAAGTRVAALIGAIANGTTFFNNADTTQISANAMTVPTQQRGASWWEMIVKIAESGDATNYWVAGILPTDPNLGTRRAYYRQSNATVTYTARQSDGLKPRTMQGKPIPPWMIVPDCAIRVDDLLVAYDTNIYTDPRVTYIQSINYDANTQQVTWLGTDDTTARAAFALKRAFKPLSKNAVNTAPTRVIVT